MDHAATVTLDRSTLDRAVRAGAMVAETATLSVDPDAPALVVAASGDTDEVRVELGPDDVASLDPAPAGALFSLSYLDRVLGGMPRDATVTLACGDDRPLALSFEFADSGTATFLVAPRTPLDR